jgi:hypothetical protein
MRLPRAFAVALVASGLAAPGALAQVAGQVGQPVEPNLVQAGALRRGPVPAALPTLEEGTRDAETQRRQQEAQRASQLAAGGFQTGRVRYPTQKEVRNRRGLTRPPNRAVIPPVSTPPGQAGAAQSLQSSRDPQLVAPGLSAPPAARRKRPQPEADPYAPLGITVGGLRVLPAIELGAGYDTNALRRSSGATNIVGSKIYQVTPEVSVRSDWSRHALQLDLRGTYSYYPDVDNANRPTMDGRLTLRGDVREQSTVTIELKERIDSQRPGSADLTGAVKGRPLYFIHSGSLAWAEKFGYATVTATGLIDRADYEDGTTFAGTTLSQKDRNYTAYGAKLRGAYELTPGVSPFVEVSGDVREYDLKFDSGSYRRSSRGGIARVGSTVEFSRVLTGEVSAGWGIRSYDDSRLANLTGAVVDASLIWQATPLTKVTARAGTEFLETTQNGSPGALGRKASLEVAHDLLRNLTITGNAGFSNASYKGVNRIEDTITAGLKADYKVNREFVVRGSYAYERSLSNTPASSYLAHVFLMGIRLQR